MRCIWMCLMVVRPKDRWTASGWCIKLKMWGNPYKHCITPHQHNVSGCNSHLQWERKVSMHLKYDFESPYGLFDLSDGLRQVIEEYQVQSVQQLKQQAVAEVRCEIAEAEARCEHVFPKGKNLGSQRTACTTCSISASTKSCCCG